MSKRKLSEVNVPQFVHNLYHCLDEPQRFMHWSEDGRSFVVHDEKELVMAFLVEKQVVKTAHYSSFVRQLNLYGFSKVVEKTRTPNVDIFYHALFARSTPTLISGINRRVMIVPSSAALPPIISRSVSSSRSCCAHMRAEVKRLQARVEELEKMLRVAREEQASPAFGSPVSFSVDDSGDAYDLDAISELSNAEFDFLLESQGYNTQF